MPWLWTVENDRYRMDAAPRPAWLAEAAFHGRALDPRAADPAADVELEQVHGPGVADADGPGRYPSCDAAVTRTRGLRLSVRTADCLPVILSDPTPILAVIHAGWRGLVADVIETTLARFPDPRAVQTILGPAIGVCCFEVGDEVAAHFPEAVIRRRPGRRPHVDLAADARRRLAAAGVSPPPAAENAPCTRCHQHLLHSYRGAGGGGGRILTTAALAR